MSCNFEGKIPEHGFLKTLLLAGTCLLENSALPETQGKSCSKMISGSHCSLWNIKMYFNEQRFLALNFNSRFNTGHLCQHNFSWLEFLFLQTGKNTGKISVSARISSSALVSQFLQNVCHFQVENATKELYVVRCFKNSLLMTGNSTDYAQEMEKLVCCSD